VLLPDQGHQLRRAERQTPPPRRPDRRASPRGARPRGRRRCPVFRRGDGAAGRHGVGRVGADLSGALPPRRVGPMVQLSRNVAGPAAPFTGGLATLSLFTGLPRSSVGPAGQLTAGRSTRCAEELRSSSTSARLVGADRACSQPRRAGASVFFSQVPGVVLDP
jgi:hypothetical protein